MYPGLYSNNEISLYKFLQCSLCNSGSTNEPKSESLKLEKQKQHHPHVQFDNFLIIYNRLNDTVFHGFADKTGNIAVTTSKSARFFIAVPIETFCKKIMPPINYFACNYQYIFDNQKFILEKVHHGQDDIILLTLDIELSNHIHKLQLEGSKFHDSIVLGIKEKFNASLLFR